MRLVVIGPGNPQLYLTKIRKDWHGDYHTDIHNLAQVLVQEGIELALLPDRGMYLDLAIEYKRLGGKYVVGLVPMGDKIWGYRALGAQHAYVR